MLSRQLGSLRRTGLQPLGMDGAVGGEHRVLAAPTPRSPRSSTPVTASIGGVAAGTRSSTEMPRPLRAGRSSDRPRLPSYFRFGRRGESRRPRRPCRRHTVVIGIADVDPAAKLQFR